MPLAGLTEWQGLFDRGELKAGERVLILNGSGGLGSLAVEFAKAAGATGSAARLDLPRSLGADRPID